MRRPDHIRENEILELLFSYTGSKRNLEKIVDRLYESFHSFGEIIKQSDEVLERFKLSSKMICILRLAHQLNCAYEYEKLVSEPLSSPMKVKDYVRRKLGCQEVDPSIEDINITQKLENMLEVMDVRLHDHLIASPTEVYSIKMKACV